MFRYAFEQWNPTKYRVLVLARDQHEQYHSMINELGLGNELKTNANVQVEVMSPETEPIARQLWQKYSDGAPIAVALFPHQAGGIGGTVAHVAAATAEGLQSIVDSKVRREIARRLGEGESAVWVLLECGEKEKDEVARATLQRQLAEDSRWLELPSAEEMEIKPEVLGQVKVKLRVGFSLIALSANQPDEQFLIDALLSSEEDLRDFHEPIAFPIFGRGLVLYALVGQGIAPDTIRGASRFICGPCSCQVKEQNPGFDLLMLHDWDKTVGDLKISTSQPSNNLAPKFVPIPAGKAKR